MNVTKVKIVNKTLLWSQLELSISLFPIKHIVLQCIKFQTVQATKIPQDTWGMFQANSPEVEHLINSW